MTRLFIFQDNSKAVRFNRFKSNRAKSSRFNRSSKSSKSNRFNRCNKFNKSSRVSGDNNNWRCTNKSSSQLSTNMSRL